MQPKIDTKYQRKLKEGLYIDWEKPELNRQINHISSTLAVDPYNVVYFVSVLFVMFCIIVFNYI